MKINYFKIINTFVQNAASAGVESKNTPETAQVLPKAVPQTAVSQTNLANLLQDIKFNAINRANQANMIRELLNLPKGIEELLSMLVSKNASSQDIEALLRQAGQKLNTDLIKQLLETNSKDSMDKLIKLFQQAPGGTQNADQMKEIMALLYQITPKKEASAQEILTNLTLLYLPLMPLAEKQNVEIKIEEREKSKESESDEIMLVVYVSTINLGRFRITIILAKDGLIKIEIENFCEENQENRKEYLEEILKLINNQARKDKINATTELMVSEQKQNAEKPQIKREIVLSPVKEISPILVLVAQKTAKIIIETDEKASLLEARKGMREEN
jgi:hypothetical protein